MCASDIDASFLLMSIQTAVGLHQRVSNTVVMPHRFRDHSQVQNVLYKMNKLQAVSRVNGNHKVQTYSSECFTSSSSYLSFMGRVNSCLRLEGT